MAGNGYLFREYIGAQGTGVRFTDVPINTGLSFHFILAFAIDYTMSQSPPAPTNGVFTPFWDTTNLTPAAVTAIKKAKPNVSVMASLAGYSLPNGDLVYFSPTSVDTWVNNAVASLTTIINQYGLDGIDVDYEHWNPNTNPAIFSDCIGQLLTRLKASMPYLKTSIAPFIDPHYTTLFDNYKSVIDYVNFQFYSYPSSTTASQYVQYFNAQKATYDGGKLLASLQSNTAGMDLVTPSNAISAFKELQSMNELYGAFIWSADGSKQLNNSFAYEKQVEAIVANH